MPLSAEDNLRLNVLLAQQLYAVRIDESKMILFALTAKREAKGRGAGVTSTPNSQKERCWGDAK